jgi:hypothetical protein
MPLLGTVITEGRAAPEFAPEMRNLSPGGLILFPTTLGTHDRSLYSSQGACRTLWDQAQPSRCSCYDSTVRMKQDGEERLAALGVNMGFLVTTIADRQSTRFRVDKLHAMNKEPACGGGGVSRATIALRFRPEQFPHNAHTGLLLCIPHINLGKEMDGKSIRLQRAGSRKFSV